MLWSRTSCEQTDILTSAIGDFFIFAVHMSECISLNPPHGSRLFPYISIKYEAPNPWNQSYDSQGVSSSRMNAAQTFKTNLHLNCINMRDEF